MATSGTYTLTVTATQIINDVFVDLGIIGADETPADDETQHAIRKLNYLIKQLEGPPNFITPAEKMWQRETATLTLSANASYDLKPSGGDLAIQIPVEIIGALLRHQTDDTDSQLGAMTHKEYLAIGDKTATGTPTKYYYERRTDKGVLYFNMVPDTSCIATYEVFISYRQPLEVISAGANEFDIQPEYYRALYWGLQKELAAIPAYASKSDFQIVSGMAGEALSVAKTFEPENCTDYFQPGKD